MGCWNETCVFSNLPIAEGEKVVLFFLKENKDYNYQWKHDTDMLPIFGEYNDYGGIQSVEDTESYKMLMHSESWADAEQLNDAKHNGDKYSQACFAHRDIYESILENFKNRKPYNQERVLGDLKKELLIKLTNKLLNLPQDPLEYLRRGFPIKEDLRRYFTQDAVKIIESQYPNKDIDKLKEELLNLSIIKQAMSWSRLEFRVPTGGSKSQETRIQSIIAEKILEKRYRFLYLDSQANWYPEEECLTEDQYDEATEETIHWGDHFDDV